MATFTNQATLSYNDTVTNSNIATGELLETLSATKTAIMNDYVANDDVTYMISIVNSGSTDFTGLTITDNLGAYAFGAGTLYPLTYEAGSIHYFVNGVLQTAPTVTAGPPLVISGIDVPAGGNVIVIYEANVNQYAPLAVGETIVNEAELNSSLSTPIVITETISTDEVPNLSISKSMSPSTVTENSEVTYTFIILNSGNTAAAAGDNVTVTDTFDPILDPITVTFDGTTWTAGTEYNYDNTTGEFATVAGQITVPAATYTQDTINGNWIVNPGVSILTVTGTI